ncbi:MAG TPA: hypothetical protein VMU16_07315 [Candidatus Binataceae bacterium]|nr:hypothetical protein [Candidatus Binataceae bacterium]
MAAGQPKPETLNHPTAGWSAWIPPGSLLTYSPAMILLLTAILSAVNYTNSDMWGHLRFGADIIARGGVMRNDPYAYSIAAQPWVSHEWLSEVIMAKAYSTWGAFGLKMIKLACAASTVIFLAAAVGETGAPLPIQGVVMMAVVVGLTPQMEFRPQDFSYALLSFVAALLARDNYRGGARLWIVIPLMAIWSNLHGGFATGLAALAVYAAAVGAQDWMEGRGLHRATRLGAIVAGAAVMTLATPYGIGTWYSVAHTISRPAMLESIVEWQPLPTAMVSIWQRSAVDRAFGVIIFGVFIAFAIAVVLAPRGKDFPLLAVAATMIWAMISALRNISLGLIATAAPLARHAALATERWTTQSRPLPRPAGQSRGAKRRTAKGGAAGDASRETASVPNHASVVTEVIIAMLAIALANRAGLFTGRIRADRDYPAGAVAFMEDNGLHGNLLAAYYWNDFLLYYCSPASHVFIDGRFETLYPDRLAQEFENFETNHPGGAAMLKDYPHDFVMIPVHYRAAHLMDNNPDWKLIYRDNVALLYARAASPAAHIPGVPVIAAAPQVTFR